MNNFIFIASSLDGYIARRQGEIDWLTSWDNPDNADFGYAEFIKKMEAVVIGSGTFKTVQQFKSWPYRLPVFVLSHRPEKLKNVFLDRVEIVQDNPKDLTARLQERGYKNLYIDGGKVIQSFLRENLIDEMIITRIPILLGAGIPLFGRLDQDIYWVHLGTITFKNGLVQSHYRKRKERS